MQTSSSIFHYLIDMNIYTQNLLVCNSGQYTCVTGYVTFSLFFKIWLTELILISREQFFSWTCFLLASNTLHHKFFLMKISSLHWNGTAYTCKEKLWWKVTGEYQNLYSFKEGQILLCQSILEMGRITHLQGSTLFTISLNLWSRTSCQTFCEVEHHAKPCQKPWIYQVL